MKTQHKTHTSLSPKNILLRLLAKKNTHTQRGKKESSSLERCHNLSTQVWNNLKLFQKLGSFVTQKRVWVPHWTTHTHTHTHTHIYIYNSHSHEALTKLKNCTCNTHICPNHHQTSLNMICDLKTSLSPYWTLCKIPMLLWFGHHILAIFYGIQVHQSLWITLIWNKSCSQNFWIYT